LQASQKVNELARTGKSGSQAKESADGEKPRGDSIEKEKPKEKEKGKKQEKDKGKAKEKGKDKDKDK